jgi:hypothetical protein
MRCGTKSDVALDMVDKCYQNCKNNFLFIGMVEEVGGQTKIGKTIMNWMQTMDLGLRWMKMG